MSSPTRNSHWLTYGALLLGNFVVGVGVLMPAGLLNELGHAFNNDAATTGKLIGYGAAVLFIEAPLLAMFTNRIDRRTLLTSALVLYALGHLASAFATSFAMLMTARLIMIGGAAAFTPQAASAIGLLVPPERRASAIASIFLGWPLASAVGVPLASFMGAATNWSIAYLIMAGACTVAAIAVFVSLPAKLHAPRLSLLVWRGIITNKKILLILAATMIFIAGQFTVYPYIAAELRDSFAASPLTIVTLFAVYGVAGAVGSLISAFAISRFGAGNTVSAHLLIVLFGLILWAASGSMLTVAIAGLIAWGYGGGPAISGQQARLVAAEPDAGSASVALNTSVLYAGQASGTYIGAVFLTQGHAEWKGIAGAILVMLALSISVSVSRRLNA